MAQTTVYVRVEGGVATVTRKPASVRVVVTDYDREGIPRIVRTEYPAQEGAEGRKR